MFTTFAQALGIRPANPGHIRNHPSTQHDSQGFGGIEDHQGIVAEELKVERNNSTRKNVPKQGIMGNGPWIS